MKMHDINPEREDVILLLHPMFANAEMMQELLADPLGDSFRYLIPDLCGHGEAAGESWQSAAGEAAQIRSWLAAHHIDRLQLGFGASMGGVILLELLWFPELQFDRLFFEGVPLPENARWLNRLMTHVMVKKHRKASLSMERTVEKMGQLYGRQAAPFMAREIIGIDEESIARIMWDCCHVRLPELDAARQARCVFAFGEKDGDLKFARKVLPEHYPQAAQVVWPGCGHCTHVTEDNVNYASMLRAYLYGDIPQ